MSQTNQRPHKVMYGQTERMSFGKINPVINTPYLIEIQKKSFAEFLEKGLKEIFADFSPIEDHAGKYKLEFGDYSMGVSKLSIQECKERGQTYSVPLRVNVNLTFCETGEVKPKEIFMGDIPMMTDKGTFIFNGVERCIVTQIKRSPGVINEGKKDAITGKKTYKTSIMPYRGAWIEFEQEKDGRLMVKLDKSPKMNVTVLLRAIGFGTNEQLRKLFDNNPMIETAIKADGDGLNTQDLAKNYLFGKIRKGEAVTETGVNRLLENMIYDPRRYELRAVGRYMYNKKLSIANRITGRTLTRDVEFEGEIIAEAGEVVTSEKAWEIQNLGINVVYISTYEGRHLTRDAKDKKGNVIFASNEEIVKEKFEEIVKAGIKKIYLDTENDTEEELEVSDTEFKVIGNNTVNLAGYIDDQFTPRQIGVYDLVYYPLLTSLIDECGGDKVKLREKLQGDRSLRLKLMSQAITNDDIVASVNYNLAMKYGFYREDDIDNLANRRLRPVGEEFFTKFKDGMSKLERAIKEKMTTQDPTDIKPTTLINIRPVTSSIRDLFSKNQLSQILDQVNPISELSHKRRISALGEGGLNRERASFEVRDVHSTHYGRMCPIETPEGQNVGIITVLSCYAKVDEYGFITTPYRRVENGVVSDQVDYLTADEEDNYIVAQANEELDENNSFVKKTIVCRHREEIKEYPVKKVNYMDIEPKQIVSVAASLIPFLENDDGKRALMGSNMQRQAVPLIKPEAPIVATGIEYKCAYDSGAVAVAKHDGVVTEASADHITVKPDDTTLEDDEYELLKFKRSNDKTCINQKVRVNVGDRVVGEKFDEKGDRIQDGSLLADGQSTDNGELSLGRNILIGFMTWEGYNYEDAILISDELVKNDTLTSIHIEDYDCKAKDTRLGPEEITRDIPNVSADLIKHLDKDGVVVVGSRVKAGDYLVGRITPKGESEPSPEDRLLKAIFQEKSGEFRDISLKVPHGGEGTVVGVEILTKENKDDLEAGVNKLIRVYIAQRRKIQVGDKMAGRHGNKGVISRVLPQADMPYLEDGTPLQIVLNPLGVPSRMNIGQVLEVHLGLIAALNGWKVSTPVFDGAKEDDIRRLFEEQKDLCEEKKINQTYYEKDGVKYYDYWKQEDGKYIYKDSDGIYQEDNSGIFVPENKHFVVDGKALVYDGRTGEPFENRATVGYMYMLKLNHLVDDKIHARSTGPYSLVTQQPLGGKAQLGGQRFGEMEVWALEAYGASHLLQEILTIKSDDIQGRQKAYESIVGTRTTTEGRVSTDYVTTPGIPEAFKVLRKEMQALCLNITLFNEEGEEIILPELYEDDRDFSRSIRPAGDGAKEISISQLGIGNSVTQEDTSKDSLYDYDDDLSEFSNLGQSTINTSTNDLDSLMSALKDAANKDMEYSIDDDASLDDLGGVSDLGGSITDLENMLTPDELIDIGQGIDGLDPILDDDDDNK